MTQVARWIIFTAVILSTVSAHAQSATLTLAPQSAIHFTLKSTLHPVHGQATQVGGKLKSDPSNPQVYTGSLRIPVRSLDTGNNRRDRNMFIMFDTENYPDIVYEVTRLRIDVENHTALFDGILHIKEGARSLQLQTRWESKGNQAVCSGNYTLSLKEFDLHPPSVIGVIRVFDSVHIEFETTWNKGV